jgi:DNA-binding MarR family transcriptional regulator
MGQATFPAPALGPLAGTLGFHVARAQVVTGALFDEGVGRPLALRKAEFSLLMLLQANGALPPKQLARELAVTAPKLTLLLDRLQRRGLLTREPHPADGRSQQVRLSAAGAQLAQRAATAAERMELSLVAALGAGHHAKLISLLAKVQATGPT